MQKTLLSFQEGKRKQQSLARKRKRNHNNVSPRQRNVPFVIGLAFTLMSLQEAAAAFVIPPLSPPPSLRTHYSVRTTTTTSCKTTTAATLMKASLINQDFSLEKTSSSRSSSSLSSRSALTELELLEEENKQLKTRLDQLQKDNQSLKRELLLTMTTTTNSSVKHKQQDDKEDKENSTYLTSRANDGDTTTETENDDFSTTLSFWDTLKDRAYWLVGLLVLQSCSGFILSHNEVLLENHPVIIYFLTMLVGAGGNAGNQASVRVIRGLALQTLKTKRQRIQFLGREFKMALALSFILSLAGLSRALVFGTPLADAIAVTAALALIVFSSVCLGSLLPLLLKRMGIDPAHSSTTIQVIMDILGVLLTVLVTTALLDSPLGRTILSSLGAA